MSYENLPDPRPLGVRLALGPMPKVGAVIVMAGLAGLCLVGIIGFCVDLMDNPFGWGVMAVVTGVLAIQYAIAIRWNDFHQTWPRRRSHRRHRVMR